jgi:hypothetical protein
MRSKQQRYGAYCDHQKKPTIRNRIFTPPNRPADKLRAPQATVSFIGLLGGDGDGALDQNCEPSR